MTDYIAAAAGTPDASITPAKLAPGLVTFYDAQLNNTRIKALPTTAVNLTPVPGAGYRWHFHGAYGLWVSPSATAYVVTGYPTLEVMTLDFVYQSIPVSIQHLLDGVQYGVLQWVPRGLVGNATLGTTILYDVERARGADALAIGDNLALQVKDDWDGVPDYLAGDAMATLNIRTYVSKVPTAPFPTSF